MTLDPDTAATAAADTDATLTALIGTLEEHERRLRLPGFDNDDAWRLGITLVELAALMRKLGAWQAMNFDGGGSTTMVIDGRVVNVPSDTTGERAVGNALLLLRCKARGVACRN